MSYSELLVCLAPISCLKHKWYGSKGWKYLLCVQRGEYNVEKTSPSATEAWNAINLWVNLWANYEVHQNHILKWQYQGWDEKCCFLLVFPTLLWLTLKLIYFAFIHKLIFFFRKTNKQTPSVSLCEYHFVFWNVKLHWAPLASFNSLHSLISVCLTFLSWKPCGFITGATHINCPVETLSLNSIWIGVFFCCLFYLFSIGSQETIEGLICFLF